MKSRQGFVILLALWLVAGISIVLLHFSLIAQERIRIGVNAAERGVGRAETLGAVAVTQALIEDALLRRQAEGNAPGLAYSDPLLGADSAFGGEFAIDSAHTVEVHFVDLGAQININTATEAQFRTFFGWVLGDFQVAQELSQTIMDWRDTDQLKRQSGAEFDDYVEEGFLALPTNATFRTVDDLLPVWGMTPELFAYVRPFLTTYGTQLINVNTAPEEVLRAIPGMSDDIVTNILNQRSRGLRIANIASVMPGAPAPTVAQITAAATVTTNQFVIEATSRPGQFPIKLRALMTRAGTTLTIGWKQW